MGTDARSSLRLQVARDYRESKWATWAPVS